MSAKPQFSMLSARVPRDLSRAINLLAVRDDTTVRYLVEEAMRRTLRERGIIPPDEEEKKSDAA